MLFLGLQLRGLRSRQGVRASLTQQSRTLQSSTPKQAFRLKLLLATKDYALMPLWCLQFVLVGAAANSQAVRAIQFEHPMLRSIARLEHEHSVSVVLAAQLLKVSMRVHGRTCSTTLGRKAVRCAPLVRKCRE